MEVLALFWEPRDLEEYGDLLTKTSRSRPFYLRSKIEFSCTPSIEEKLPYAVDPGGAAMSLREGEDTR